jgi:hypothetical protein
MLAVLMCSSKIGSSSWADARGRGEIHISGMQEGDVLQIIFRSSSEERETDTLVMNNCTVHIPFHTDRVMVEHKEVGGGKVCVDLR